MKKIFPTLIAFLFVFNTYSQNNSFNPNSPVGSKIVIEALDYTNDINKYYFNKNMMSQLASFLLANNHISIEVNCFSDFVEVPLMNLMASADQANDIRNYLVKQGIAGSRINTIGNGDMFPIVEENIWLAMNSEEQRIANNKNRRIEIVIIKQQNNRNSFVSL